MQLPVLASLSLGSLPFSVSMPCDIMDLEKKETCIMMEHDEAKLDAENSEEESEEHVNVRKPSSAHNSPPGPDSDYKIDDLFYHICHFCFIIGVNFYRDRCTKWRCVSLLMVIIICSINLYFIGYVVYRTILKPFDPERVATAISISTWVLQATLSTLFLAYWQYTSQPCKIIKLLYSANKGVGIHQHRVRLSGIVTTFYVVVALSVFFYSVLIVTNQLDINIGKMDTDIYHIFGNRRLLIIVQLTSLYTIFCWSVALFVYGLLIHAAHYEFIYFNEQVQSSVFLLLPLSLMKMRSNMEQGDFDAETDEALCNYIQKLMRIHSRLTECVKRLDKMFNRYAFVMISTIIPTTIFSLFMIFRNPSRAFSWVGFSELLINWPLVFFCLFSFFALVNAPSQLHNTIYATKSALCSNTHIWFPYRPNVYTSALAFIAHLDQTNLGVSVWGFVVVSKKLVLTTLSVMMTCLALFLDVGDCKAAHKQ